MSNEFKIESRPVTGEARDSYSPPLAQRSPEEFVALVDSILAIEGVEALRWTQYTPYFNDGEECVFGFGTAFVKLSFGDEDGGDYEDGFYDQYSLYEYDRGFKNRIFKINGHNTEAIYEALSEFERQFDYFESVAKANFGDHAEVTATKAGFNVEYYEHD